MDSPIEIQRNSATDANNSVNVAPSKPLSISLEPNDIAFQLTLEISELLDKNDKLSKQLLQSNAKISELEIEIDDKSSISTTAIKKLEETIESLNITIHELIEQQTSEFQLSQSETIRLLMEDLENADNINAELVRDLLAEFEGFIGEVKEQFIQESEVRPELNLPTTVGMGTQIWDTFHGAGEQVKGVLLVAICFLYEAMAGWASWRFIAWVWPRLLVLAETLCNSKKMQLIASWICTAFTILTSTACKKFFKAWQDGKSLDNCLAELMEHPKISSIIKTAGSTLVPGLKKLMKLM